MRAGSPSGSGRGGRPGGGIPRGSLRRYEHVAMGTLNVLLLQDPDPSRPGGADHAAAAAFRLLDRLEDEISRFRPESDVCLLNALGAGGFVPVGKALFEILEASKAAWEETGGVFDPTVGPLMDAWGFPRGPGRIPPEDEIAGLLQVRGMDHVILDSRSRSARFDREGVALDLGSVGKGYAADRAAEILEEKGVPAGAFISGSSSILAWGSPPEGGPWTVQVAHPGRRDESIRTLEMDPGSISTSGSYEERFEAGGVEYGHIFDPRTGRPVQGMVRSVTVWTPDALQGDILSTVLFVLGREEGERLLEARSRAGRGEGGKCRASVLFVEEDRGAPGGLSVRAFHAGPPGFRDAEDP